MLKDCIEIFEKEIEEYKKNNPSGDEISFITDDYALTAGTYYLLDLETGEIKETLEVDKNSTDKSSLYEKFAKMEYLSMYMDSNKAIADKNIFSNNIYSFIAKKENVAEKITDEVIDGYYNKILTFTQNSDTDKKKLYIAYEEENGATNVENAEKAKTAIKKFVAQFDAGSSKGRLAVFFDVDLSEYEKEGYRYIVANVYNTNEYNYQKQSEIFGLPNNNMGLNSDKPYLKNKSRINDLPYALSQEDVMLQKLFFDDLSNKVKHSKSLIKNDNKTQANYYMHLTTDNGEAIIDDYSIIFNNEKFEIHQNNYLNNNYEYQYIAKNKNELIEDIDKFLYNFNLKKHLYKSEIDIKKYPRLTQNLKQSNKAWGDWFYKNNDKPIKAVLNKIFISRILDTLVEPPKEFSSFYQITDLATLRFNIFYSIKNYLRKDTEAMIDEFKQIYDKIKEKINSDETKNFENDKEAFFAMGQLEYYFIYKKKNAQTHDDAIPFLTSVYSKNAKNEIFKLFKIRSYDIPLNWKNFNNLYAMIQEYDYPKKMDKESVLAGYLHSCILLENTEKEDANNIK